ncbi:uncharacterized protein EDB91DRAFT_1085420 [Suillus paluster]|uniref:uncharacterized protein n=1 Tax=Suillus paluster TaxID=48578 RepID=UPI001B868A86|nr:uncharacterized protein EDB91DRAFT_1085420 [Suillus paluster]KAG1730549.1 hypothetical protein EDB91DRAFT_1085420 [Suillus paluster]
MTMHGDVILQDWIRTASLGHDACWLPSGQVMILPGATVTWGTEIQKSVEDDTVKPGSPEINVQSPLLTGARMPSHTGLTFIICMIRVVYTSDVFIVSQILATRFPSNILVEILDVREPLEGSPNSAPALPVYKACPSSTPYTYSPPYALKEAFLDLIHTFLYIAFTVSACALFSKPGSRCQATGPREIAKHLKDQQMVMAGCVGGKCNVLELLFVAIGFVFLPDRGLPLQEDQRTTAMPPSAWQWNEESVQCSDEELRKLGDLRTCASHNPSNALAALSTCMTPNSEAGGQLSQLTCALLFSSCRLTIGARNCAFAYTISLASYGSG